MPFGFTNHVFPLVQLKGRKIYLYIFWNIDISHVISQLSCVTLLIMNGYFVICLCYSFSQKFVLLNPVQMWCSYLEIVIQLSLKVRKRINGL